MRNQVDVFHVTTPRHWLIASALAYIQKKPAILLIENTFSDADKYVEATKNWSESPFIDVIQVFGKRDWLCEKGLLRAWLKHQETHSKRRLIKQLSGNYAICSFYSASVRDWFCQYVVHLVKRSNNPLEVYYLDDGARTYFDEKSAAKSKLNVLSRKLSYGSWYEYPSTYQKTPWLKSAYVFHPMLVNSDIKNLNVNKIEPAWFELDSLRQLHHNLFVSLGFGSLIEKLTLSSGQNTFFIFTKLSLLYKNCPNFNLEKFKSIVYKAIETAENNGEVVWIKYHPREEGDDVFHIIERFENIHMLPHGFAFDLLLPYLSEGDKMFGEMSTVLFDVALQRPKVEVHSLGCLDDDSMLSKTFQKAGVNLNPPS